ncbi:MAG: hypothetical protein WC178_02800 [Candidatus Paceibacterota bacterium]
MELEFLRMIARIKQSSLPSMKGVSNSGTNIVSIEFENVLRRSLPGELLAYELSQEKAIHMENFMWSIRIYWPFKYLFSKFD